MILAFYSEQAGTGKDTAADFAHDYLFSRGVAAVRDAFAWDGKVVCADALGITGTREEKIAAVDRIKLTGRVYYDLGAEETGSVEGREFIIGLLGSPGKGNGVRGRSPKFWTNQVVNRSKFTTGWTVVSDMRYLEEAESVRAESGLIVEIVRGKNLGKFNEQRLPREMIDHVIVNNGTLESLRAKVEQYVGFLIGAVEAVDVRS